jgi:hypothetical protein
VVKKSDERETTTTTARMGYRLAGKAIQEVTTKAFTRASEPSSSPAAASGCSRTTGSAAGARETFENFLEADRTVVGEAEGPSPPLASPGRFLDAPETQRSKFSRSLSNMADVVEPARLSIRPFTSTQGVGPIRTDLIMVRSVRISSNVGLQANVQCSNMWLLTLS